MIRQSDLWLTAVAALAVILTLGAPLAFGGSVAWAETGLRVLAFLALAVAMKATAERLASLRPVAVAAAALGGVALLGLAQALPWPAAAVRLVSPEHARLWEAAAALGTGVDLEDGGEAGTFRLTLAADASRSAALTWAAAAACLLVGAALGAGRSGRERRRWLGAAVLAGAAFQVLYGTRGWFARSNEIWGVAVAGSPSRLRGTFVNPNHLALFLEIALALLFAWGWWAARRVGEEVRPERRVLLLALPALLWLTLFAVLAFTGSRAGLAAALAAVVAQGFLSMGRRRRWLRAGLGIAAALAGLGLVAFLGLRQGLGRLLSTSSSEVSLDARRQAWEATLELWSRFPLFGSGLGTFRDAFPLVQPRGLAGTWWHAHSDPLELLATAGLLGGLLVAAGLAVLVRRLWKVLRQGSRSEDRAAALAAFGALVAAGLHEMVDFGLTLPANALVLALVLGAAAAARTRPAAAVTGSEQADGARQHPPARQLAQLKEVDSAGEPQRQGQKPGAGRRRGHRRRH
ncbi:MAG TPA: O-antigen ligase family protein [Thermoanaerobaculia bacterium]|nr:O-antigen ligase family protein [Thermoanaerobaculia bacterium]